MSAASLCYVHRLSALDCKLSSVTDDTMHRGMINSISLRAFSYRKSYHKLQAMDILGDMFSSPDVQQYMQVHHL